MGDAPFVRACECGDILEAQRLWRDEFTSAEIVHGAFVKACLEDHVNIARWLMTLGIVIPQKCYVHIIKYYARRDAAAVISTLEFVRRHAEPFYSGVVNTGFRRACNYGHLEMAQYMHEVFGANVFLEDAELLSYPRNQDLAAWIKATRAQHMRWDARRTWIVLCFRI